MPQGQLSRAEMEQVIKSGGSVLHDGRLYSRVESLPSEADLAKGDPDREQAAAAGLQAQMDALKAELAKLQPAAPSPAPAGTPVYDATSETLATGGYATREDVQAASDEDLLKVPGIGPATLKKLRAELEA